LRERTASKIETVMVINRCDNWRWFDDNVGKQVASR